MGITAGLVWRGFETWSQISFRNRVSAVGAVGAVSAVRAVHAVRLFGCCCGCPYMEPNFLRNLLIARGVLKLWRTSNNNHTHD